MVRRLDYFFRETFQGLKRNGLVAFAAVSTAFIALFLLGLALLASREVGLLIDSTTKDVEVSVYLRDDISPAQQQNLQRLITSMPQVEAATYESKSDAYENFKRIFHEQEDLVRNVGPDALPASFRIKLVDPEKFEVVRARLEGQPGIDNIRDNRQILKRLFAAIRVFRLGGIGVAIVMLVSAAALIGNTVRMAVFARRKEIGIMRLVGATSWFIRIPFMIEGVVEGLLGAGVAILALFIMKLAFVDALRNLVGFLPLIRSEDVMFTVPWLIGISIVVSVGAGIIATRRFLEV